MLSKRERAEGNRSRQIAAVFFILTEILESTVDSPSLHHIIMALGLTTVRQHGRKLIVLAIGEHDQVVDIFQNEDLDPLPTYKVFERSRSEFNDQTGLFVCTEGQVGTGRKEVCVEILKLAPATARRFADPARYNHLGGVRILVQKKKHHRIAPAPSRWFQGKHRHKQTPRQKDGTGRGIIAQGGWPFSYGCCRLLTLF